MSHRINYFRRLSHKPHIIMVYGRYVCATHNARGEGHTVNEALRDWKQAQRAFENMQWLRDQKRVWMFQNALRRIK